MGDNSKIEWTDATWNVVTGCTKVSAGCKHCYAERQWPRLAAPGQPYAGRDFTDVACHQERLDQPLTWRRPRRIFVNSMSDLFHEAVPDSFLDEVFAVMISADWHIFQVLTKRPERMRAYMRDWERRIQSLVPGHIWLGVSCEDQTTAAERIPKLLETPAGLRFVSLEPLLGPINLRRLDADPRGHGQLYQIDALDGWRIVDDRPCPPHPLRLDWVVVGGESGPKARPMHINWVRDIAEACRRHRTPFFFKQWGEWAPALPERATHIVWKAGGWEPRHGMDLDAISKRGGKLVLKVGKRAAGRALAGEYWDGMPAFHA